MQIQKCCFESEIKSIRERKESIEEAKTIDYNLRKAYRNLGFELIEVPLIAIEERAKFILTEIGLQIEA